MIKILPLTLEKCKSVAHVQVVNTELILVFQFYNDYGDIIKACLGKAREINKVLTAKTLAMSLTQVYFIA